MAQWPPLNALLPTISLQTKMHSQRKQGRIKTTRGVPVCPFSTKNYAKMSVDFKTVGSFAPEPRLRPLPLSNPGCATGQAYEVLPPKKTLGWLRHWRRHILHKETYLLIDEPIVGYCLCCVRRCFSISKPPSK